ncbi:MAG: nucleotidyltransferase domain-containing protein [Candidatus Woesearchaeota archaeon]
MEFQIKKRDSPVKTDRSKEDVDIAYKFARSMWKEFDRFIKAVVLFGSAATEKNSDDIDILVIVDDVSFYITPELVEAYRVITESIVIQTSPKLHITTLKFTSFWDYIRAGDPVGLNILRDGVALIDTGFFYPVQLLLFDGKIRPSKEAVTAYHGRSIATLHNSRWHVLQATLDLYWACIDSAHAALMDKGELPPNPRDIAKVLEEKLVKEGLLHKKHVKTMEKMYNLSKRILHREIKDINGKDFEEYYKISSEFLEAIKKILDKKK